MEAAGWLFLYNCRLREDLGLNDAGATMLDTLVLAAAAYRLKSRFMTYSQESKGEHRSVSSLMLPVMLMQTSMTNGQKSMQCLTHA